MIYRGWFDTENGGEMLLEYDTGSGDVEKRKANFLAAVANAEIETGVIFALNDNGRRLVDEIKANRKRLQPFLI